MKRKDICRKSQCMTKRKSFLIAMSGGSGSGKSTLAEALLSHLPEGQAVMFGEDAYYHPMSYYGEPANEEERLALIATINYDAPASKEVDHLVKDLRALKSCGAALNGAISGRALYDGAIDLAEALAVLKA